MYVALISLTSSRFHNVSISDYKNLKIISLVAPQYCDFELRMVEIGQPLQI